MKIKKEITFIYSDKVEYLCEKPIADEAEKRGYKIIFSTDIFQKCEIGIYCQHVNFAKNSKLSFVMLHDLGQQHGEWPNMWKNEFWSQFDVGLLPNKEWVDMWGKSSCYDFVRPKKGCYFVGWPKSDDIYSKSFKNNCERIIDTYKIDRNKKTVLYAPSWEWDNRQLEIIEACRDLDVNLVIKQFPSTPERFPEQYKIITDLAEKSKNIDNVFVLDPSLNIFDAITISDILVSEESSTLYEAMMLDKPVIAVTDWLIPDNPTKPPRLPDFPYKFAIHTTKKNLKKTITDVIENNQYIEKIVSYRKENYPNIGNASKNVLDVIDSIIDNKPISNLRINEKQLIKTPKELSKLVKSRKKSMRHIYLYKRFIENNSFLLAIYSFLLKIGNKIKKCHNQ